MKKELEVEKNPIIQIYQHHAYGFSILGNNERGFTWAYNKYIQLIYTPAYGFDSFNYFVEFMTKQAPFLWEGLSDLALKKLGVNILDYIKMGLEQEKFPWLCIDEFYLPDSRNYNKNHFMHDILLYGYDDEREEFLKLGYNRWNHYDTSIIAYDDLLQATPCFIKFLEINHKYHFSVDIKNMKKRILRYLNAEEECTSSNIEFQTDYYCFSQLKTNQKSFYGIEACEKVNEEICNIIRQGMKLDLRPSALILEVIVSEL